MHDPVCVDRTICPFGTNILELDNLKKKKTLSLCMIFIYSYLDDSQHQEQLGLGFKVA